MTQDISADSRETSQPDRIRSVTDATFASLVLEGAGPIVVEFMSYGCAHCRALEPALQQVAGRVKSQATIFRVNTAIAQDLADSYGVTGTPTLVMFLNGDEVGRAEGPHPTVNALLEVLAEAFQS